MNSAGAWITLRFSGERATANSDFNLWPQPAVISELKSQLTTDMKTKEFREPSQEEIACAAYFHWMAEGLHDGQEQKHWFAAETELMQQQAAEEGTLWARDSEDVPAAEEKLNQVMHLC
jgi:hypothetical protein